MVLAMLVIMFPKRLPLQSAEHVTDASAAHIEQQAMNKKSKTVPRESLREGLQSLKRVLKNKIFMTNLASSLSTVFFFSGFGTFIPKFFQVGLLFCDP